MNGAIAGAMNGLAWGIVASVIEPPPAIFHWQAWLICALSIVAFELGRAARA